MMRKTWAAAALSLALAACGGGTGSDTLASAAPKGYGPAQLYHPAANPAGHVLQEGDTGVVLLQPAAQDALQIWFDVADASTYGVELEDEDLATLSRVQITDATGQVRLAATPQQRRASTDLAAGRYVLHMEPSATHAQTTPMFIRFESEPAAANGLVAKADFGHVLGTVFTRSCINCDLRGAHLALLLLYDAQLFRSNLSGANLANAILTRADLRETALSGADLHGANLSNANLRLANLTNADLRGANLLSANLETGRLRGAKLGGATWPNGRVCSQSSFPGECN